MAEAEFLFPEAEGETKKKTRTENKPETTMFLPEISRNLRRD